MSMGFFTICLTSLQAQMEGLMDGVGGEDTVALLDEVARLTPAEQRVLLQTFLKVTRELVEERSEWRKAVESEDNSLVVKLCEEILSEINLELEEQPLTKSNKLKVIDGGQAKTNNTIPFPCSTAEREARLNRLNMTDPVSDPVA